ncbi:hypothetical protein [Streptomyces sp. ML-6]|uniref:hypothetical protein n=1 Tax=Streptomyces sp. ML-6 TaxID=2982693 RepID=UPI0024C030D8|nr:hypothetical protein [Streptomyces sp. ML-6]MDK0517905.1 hypothetical protein [Streptomyces sp. ML-6]
MPADEVPPNDRDSEKPGSGAELPATLHIAGLALSLVESPPSLACWSGGFPVPTGADPVGVSLVIEPSAPPPPATLRRAHDVVSRFDILVARAEEYCRTRLREEQYGLTAEELDRLDLPEPPWGLPEATVWTDRSWMIRFAESGLRMGDPYGILVTFDGTRPVDVQGTDDE